jgi:hypothetical protein
MEKKKIKRHFSVSSQHLGSNFLFKQKNSDSYSTLTRLHKLVSPFQVSTRKYQDVPCLSVRVGSAPQLITSMIPTTSFNHDKRIVKYLLYIFRN